MKTKIRILHVDDSILDRLLIRDTLMYENDEFEITEADNREKFENLILNDDFDIILSDFNILGFDGLQVLEVVKEKNAELPVIIVTGTGSEEIAIKAMKTGAADYVIKSVNHIKGLPATIKSVLNHKKTENDLKIAQAALKESEALFRTAFENASIGVCLVSPDYKFISVNNTLCNIVGYSKLELENMYFAEITHPDDISKSLDYMSDIKSGVSQSATFEKRYIHKDGHVVWVSISTGLISKELRDSSYIITHVQDISDRKEAERQLIIAKDKAEESDRLKTAFLNNISHEIRTPMNAIMGFAELLGDVDNTPEKQSEFVNIIIKSSQQLLSIITDIISIATIEAGQEIIREAEVNVNQMFGLLYKQFKSKANDKGIDLIITKALPDKDVTFVTDKTKLIQIITNLLNNSFKFTETGFIEAGYYIKGKDIEFYVKDSGIGIPDDMYEEIFKRFRQIETSSMFNMGGSGLGLSISKAYAELLGGNIRVSSEPGKLTVFSFSLPFGKHGTLNKEKSVITGCKELSCINESKNILIAEDEDSNYKLLKAFLSKTKLNVIRASNGIEAIEICKTNSDIDLVLMDIKMPLMNGLEATKQIKELRPDLHIIAQSAYSNDNDKANAFAYGCIDFISKPVKKEILISKINKHIKY